MGMMAHSVARRLQLGSHRGFAPKENMKLLTTLLTLALLAASGFAQTNTVTNAFILPPPIRIAHAVDLAAYVRAGGSSNATGAAIATWQRYRLLSNGVWTVPVAVVHSTTNNPLNAYGQWLRSLCQQAGATAPFTKQQAMSALVNWSKSATNTVVFDGLIINCVLAEDVWRDLQAQGYDLNKLPPGTLPVTNWIYGRLP